MAQNCLFFGKVGYVNIKNSYKNLPKNLLYVVIFAVIIYIHPE